MHTPAVALRIALRMMAVGVLVTRAGDRETDYWVKGVCCNLQAIESEGGIGPNLAVQEKQSPPTPWTCASLIGGYAASPYNV